MPREEWVTDNDVEENIMTAEYNPPIRLMIYADIETGDPTDLQVEELVATSICK